MEGPNQVVKVWHFVSANALGASFDNEPYDTITDPWNDEAD